MKPNKDSSMLFDVQYIKANKKENTKDMLYIIWKDLDTMEKHLQVVEEPKWNIYFEKPEYRDHDYIRRFQSLSKCNIVGCKYSDTTNAIIHEMGEQGKAFRNRILETKQYSEFKRFQLYPYVFGSDLDIRAWYRAQWLRKNSNNRVKKISKGMLDIEVITYGHKGMLDSMAEECKISAVTLTDSYHEQVYTFLLDVIYEEKPLDDMSKSDRLIELRRREMYKKRHEQVEHLGQHAHDVEEEMENLFNPTYGDLKYHTYIYTDEAKLLVHLFQLINKLKLDMIGIWNMPFDIPYIMDRFRFHGLDPKDYMCHQDFPVKECWFKFDKHNFQIKNKSDYFYCSSYTVFVDSMVLYAAIRKGCQELRSNKLDYVCNKELKEKKVQFDEDYDIRTIEFHDFKTFWIYNVKDTLLMHGLEKKTSDMDTLYVSSYENATPYESVFKQTIVLRNVQYMEYFDQGFIVGNNPRCMQAYEEPEEDDDEEGNPNDAKFEGALVADPRLNGYYGLEMYGKASNNIFEYAIDMDMSAFYPSSIIAMNIGPTCLIFKMIIPRTTFMKESKLRRITSLEPDVVDVAKELMDNYQTGNMLCTAYKWLNAPSVTDVYERMCAELGK